MNTTARQIALLSLCRCESDGKYSNLENDAAIKKFALEGAEKKLYSKLLYGTIEKKITLDHIISQISSKKLEDMSLQMLNILRMAIYQLRYLDRIPDHAAVAEAVELAKKYVSKASASFVNAVLREYLRRDNSFEFPDKNDDYTGYLSVRYSVSPDVLEALLSSCGAECEKMLDYFEKNEQYITIRVNTLKNTVDELVEKLTSNGIKCKKTKESPFGINLLQNVDIGLLTGIVGDGGFIEDEASQIAVASLELEPSMTVCDVCSAPGGKSISSAIQMKNEGKIYAHDLHANKLGLIEKTAKKLGIDIIEVSVRNGKLPVDEEKCGKFDRVICDVPCSGLGVIGKKPDLRYKDMDVDKLIETQYEILSSSCHYLKPGGRLLYSTCTLNRAENDAQTDKFLKENTGYTLISSRTLMPHKDGTDGFYIAVIEKNG